MSSQQKIDQEILDEAVRIAHIVKILADGRKPATSEPDPSPKSARGPPVANAGQPWPDGVLATTPAQIISIGVISKTNFWDRVAKGEIKVRKLGRKTLVMLSDWRDFLKACPPARSARRSQRYASTTRANRPSFRSRRRQPENSDGARADAVAAVSKAYPLQRRPRMSVSKPTRQHNRGGLPSRRTVRREARREVLGGRVTGRDGFIFAQSLYCFVRTQQAKPDWERQFSNERDAGKLLNALGYNAETLEMLWGGDYLPPGSVDSVDARLARLDADFEEYVLKPRGMTFNAGDGAS